MKAVLELPREYICTFIYPYKQKYVFNRGPTLPKIFLTALTLGVNPNLLDFYHKIMAHHMDACIKPKSDILSILVCKVK